MITTGRARTSETPVDKLLITKIITGVGLALLLIIGAWSGGHRDAEVAPSLTTAHASSLGEIGEDLIVPAEGADGVAAERGLTESVSGYAVIGGVGCLLGIVCCFLVLIFARTSFNRVPSQTRERMSRVPTPIAMTGRLFTLPPSLTQLSLSRT